MIIKQINKLLNILGSYLLFLFITLKTLIKEGCNKSFLLKQIEHLGINSIIICVVTGGFSGAVMALQSYKGFQQFGGHHLIGMIVALTLTRELGPVLTGLMVAGRVGAGIASEIGSMKVTEQIDALQVLHIQHPDLHLRMIPSHQSLGNQDSWLSVPSNPHAMDLSMYRQVAT